MKVILTLFSLANGVTLPVQFTARDPGHYPCQISLKSVNDIRVYQIECTVSPGGLDTQLEFTTPLHQSVTQEIPVVSDQKICFKDTLPGR